VVNLVRFTVEIFCNGPSYERQNRWKFFCLQNALTLRDGCAQCGSVCVVAMGIEQLQLDVRIMNIPEMMHETLLES
jgi:hypothetical protein